MAASSKYPSATRIWEDQGLEIMVIGPEGDQVWMKTHSGQVLDQEGARRLKNERDLRRRLKQYPGWPQQLRNVAEDDLTRGLLLDPFEGETLSMLLKREGRPFKETLQIALTLVRMVERLHQVNILHGSLHPTHIFISDDLKSAITADFSKGLVIGSKPEEEIGDKLLEGDLSYLAPEQTGRGNQPVDLRTDLYSLGVLLFELLVGTKPFSSADPQELIHAHLAQNPPDPLELNPALPLVLATILNRLLSKNPDERYQSAYGLRRDLERCLRLFLIDGGIVTFEPGTDDTVAQLKMELPLIGREEEQHQILKGFLEARKGKTGMVLLRGSSGVGKSALVQSLALPIRQQGGLMISGPFDRLREGLPFSGWIDAFDQWVEQQLALSPEELEQRKMVWERELGNFKPVLANLVPSISRLLGEQEDPVRLNARESRNRFYITLNTFIRINASAENPLVIFLDDLQWADEASLELLDNLLQDNRVKGLLLITAIQSTELRPESPASKLLEEMGQEGGIRNHFYYDLEIEGLTADATNQLLAKMMGAPPNQTLDLGKLIHEKTKGNVFFAQQFIRSLYNTHLLTFDRQEHRWKWDLEAIAQLDITENVIEFLLPRVQQLPTETQHLLRLSACIGNPFDVETLGLLVEKTTQDVVRLLQPAVQEGVTLPQSDTSQITIPKKFRFSHDRLYLAVYQIVSDSDSRRAHLQVGRMLLQNTKPEELEARVFEIVNQFNKGNPEDLEAGEKIQLAKLNQKAGQKARKANAYELAWQYFKAGIELLGNKGWRENYDLNLSLHNGAAEAAYLVNRLPEMQEIVDRIVAQGRSILDKIEAYEVSIFAARSQNELKKAVQIGKEVLAKLDLKLPAQPNQLDGLVALVGLRLALVSKSPEKLAQLPNMDNPRKEAAMRIMAAFNPAAYFSEPNLVPITIARNVQTSIRHGNHTYSAGGYGAYGLLLCGFFGQMELGDRFADLALEMMDRFPQPEMAANDLFTLPVFVRHWTHPLSETLPQLEAVYQKALETGDLEFVGFGSTLHIIHSFFAGLKLPDILTRGTEYSRTLLSLGQERQYRGLGQSLQAMVNLIEGGPAPAELRGRFYDEAEMFPYHQDGGDNTTLLYGYCFKVLLTYLHGQPEEALELAQRAQELTAAGVGTYFVSIFHFYHALSLVAVPTPKNLRQAKKLLSKLQKWSRNSPNLVNKFHLLAAELARTKGKLSEARQHYDQAIQKASEMKFPAEEALAWERYGEFFLSLDQTRLAGEALRIAYQTWAGWGAKSKMEDLEERFPALVIYANESPGGESGRKAEVSGDQFDLASVLKASTAISGEIVPDRLVGKMMKIVAENAAAQRGLLILKEENELVIAASYEIGSKGQEEIAVHEDLPALGSELLPDSVLNYVFRSEKEVVLENASESVRFSGDEWITQHRTQSLLCMPIKNRGQLSGIVYLENNLANGVFNESRVQTLSLLASQIAVSLENSRVYERLEDLVEIRTQELSQTLDNLRSTQQQLVQAEKMASLGQLTAGLAHEINNATNYICSGANSLKRNLAELKELIEAYQALGEQPSAEQVAAIQKLEQEIEPDFSLEEAAVLTQSIFDGGKRTASIVKSLRTFSRLDEDSLKAVDIAENLDATIILMQNLLEDRIEIKKDFEQGLTVEAFPGKLNQVFLNILTNATQAIEGKGEIHLQTKAQEIDGGPGVAITIRDTGAGIAPEVLEKIFDPFFTTKDVGRGSGLGLSTSLSMVEDHNGRIEVSSEFGKGTAFTILLPCQQPNGNEAQALKARD